MAGSIWMCTCDSPTNVDGATEDIATNPAGWTELVLGQQGILSEKVRPVAGDDALARTWSIASSRRPTGTLGPLDSEEVEDNTVMDKVYDYYDPVAKEFAVRGMYSKVVHSRRRRVSIRETLHQSSSFTSEASDSSSSSCKQEGRGEERFKVVFKREVVTNWGVIVGKALWFRMSGQGEEGRRSKLGVLAVAKQDRTGFDREADLAPPQVVSRKSVRAVKMAERRSAMVVAQVRALMKRVGRETVDRFDDDWQEELLAFLFSADYSDTLMILANGARTVLSKESSLIQVDLPCKVFGDIHGQLRDLLLLFHAYGMPGEDRKLKFVFNGDFVDRGRHQIEVIGVLMALKLRMPDHVFLVRGNHEDLQMNKRYGFEEACKEQLGPEFGPKAFDLFQKAFDYLPLACLLDKQILVVHGGVGDGKWSLEDLMHVSRPFTSEDLHGKGNEWIFNILWSDPIEEDAVTRQDSTYFGVHQSPRSTRALQFGWNITKVFCARNGLSCVIRSHQCQEEGLGFNVMHEDILAQVFSARDYEAHGNDAAVLSVHESETGALNVRPQVLSSFTKKLQEEEEERRWTG